MEFDPQICLTVAQKLAREAGAICLEIQDKLTQITLKSPKDVVTEADIASDRHISAGLKAAFPTHGLRTEEEGIQGSQEGLVWIVDPVDGTVNFSRGMPMWGISIALVKGNETLVAVCYLPRLDEMYTAVRGQGAFRNGQPIRVSQTDELSRAVASNGDFNVGPHEGIAAINAQNIRIFSSQATHMQRVKSVGSAVFEGCFVASGRLDVFSMTMSYPWDIAGIALLVQEAGGQATLFSGLPIELRDHAQCVFSNGTLHQAYLQQVLAQA